MKYTTLTNSRNQALAILSTAFILSAGPSPATAAAATAAPASSPEIAGDPTTQTTINEAYSFAPTASDADGDPLTFTIANLPEWLSFASSTGALTGTPTNAQVGVYRNVTIQVESGGEYDTLAAFDIEVVAVGAKGITLSWAPPTQNEDGSSLGDLAGYKIMYGQEPGVFTKVISVPNGGATSYSVEGLVPGTYYFVIRAFNAKGVDSIRSNEATTTL